MSAYTIKSLKDDVEDAAPKFGFPPDLEARFARDPLGCERSGLSYQRLAPHFRYPFGHRHEQQEELYVLISGSARVKLDEEVHELKPLDAVRVAAGTMRSFEAGPAGAELLAFGEGARDKADITPGWWNG